MAVVLAFVAAGLNAMWLSARKSPPTFVAASTDLPMGQEITDDMLTAVPVPGDTETLRASLIPYANRAILYGLKTPRNYIRGDMFFQRDIQAPLEPAKFEILGPFRLISVGERFKQAESPQEGEIDPGGNNVTIAVSAKFDERTRRLLEIIDPNQSANRENKLTRIVAVQVIPKDETSTATTIDETDVVYQTVSLQGIENVPRVLLAGDDIRFVIPVSDSL
jgi:hypothetical protein